MKSLSELWKVMAKELAIGCHTSAALDCNKLERRVEKEGVSFLTLTLPRFGRDFERCLDLGSVDSTAFAGFTRRGGPLPLFLGGFLELIFDSSSGAMLTEPSVDAIFAIRQLTLVFKKILIPCSDARVEKAMKRFIECEQELEQVRVSEEDYQAFDRISHLLFADVFSDIDRKVYDFELVPKHGPGATSDGLRGNAKYDLKEWNSRLDRTLPYGEFGIASWRFNYQEESIQFLEPDAERPVKVVPVPKTLKSPRIIAIEPTCMQYMQQALLDPLVHGLESEVIAPNKRKNLAFGFLGFRDQHPNRELAHLGSNEEGTLATLDLSEASDRVLNSHVLRLLHRYPHFSEAVQATRSQRASVPRHGNRITIPLVKFASMGSALCFPMEAMVFLTVVLCGIERKHKTPLSRKSIQDLRGMVRVYGDDIICPVDCVPDVISALEDFGFLVNRDKSFWTGRFRESCGGDYYGGFDVTPVKLTQLPPSTHRDASEMISLVSFRNHVYKRGLWGTARYLDEKIGKVLPYYPVVRDTSPALGRHSFLDMYTEERTDAHLHKPMVKAYVNVSRPPRSDVSGEGALLKCLLGDRREPFADSKHLEYQGRPRAVVIKPRWIPA